MWALVTLSILGMSLSSVVFQEIKFARVYKRLVISMPAVRSAVRAVFDVRKNDPTPLYDTLGELSREERLDLCPVVFCRYYFLDKITPAKVVDESALINLNTASVDVLKRLPGINDDLAKGIVYSGLRPFSSANEVLLVEGASKEAFLLFKDLVTVYGTGKVNINTAEKKVLLALGLDEELAEIIIRFRSENKIEPPEEAFFLEPEYGIASLDTLLDDLRGFASLSLRQEQDLLSLLTTFDVRSEYLRFNVVTHFGEEKGSHYSIVIHPATKKVISWREE